MEQKVIALYDVGGCIRSWGRLGIIGGGIFGFVLGVVLVTIPFTTNIPTFGIIGTLIVASVEGAVIAGAFGACAAALCGNGVLCDSAARFDRARSAERRRSAGSKGARPFF